jgi:flagellar brake protein
MTLDTRPAALDALGGEDRIAEFRLTGASAIARWLRELRDSAIPIILSGPDGTSYASTLWSHDAAAGRLSLSADEQHQQPQRLVDADEAVAVAHLDNVKLQFELKQLVLVRGANSCAIQAAYPKVIYRFQRRGSFRVRTAGRAGPCATFRHPSMPEMTVALRILDVSIGGCALLQPRDIPPLQAGTRIQRIHVELDADTRFNTGIQVHHISSQANGSAHRLGCEWQAMDGAAQRALQRFIDQTQKRRHLLSLDL